VIVGAGFGGLQAVKALKGKPVNVLVLDRHNHHTFIPLLYEVASAGLDPDDIAQPVRAILRGVPNARFRLANVEAVNLDRRVLRTAQGDVSYDYLVLAAGSTTNYFGVESARESALAMRDVSQATGVRAAILRNFELAETAANDAERDRLMTIIVIGGGPTGVELSGALAELKTHVLARDHPDLDMSRARVILLEATDTLLGAFPPRLRRKAEEQLRTLGVDVRLQTAVESVDAHGVTLRSGGRIDAENVVWVAGARGEALGSSVTSELAPGSRVHVTETLQLPEYPEVFVIGDLAHAETPDGRGYPMLAPVAMQQGQLAARNIMRQIEGRPLETFRYRDRGIMATIGRRKAVAHVFHLQFSGFIAWLMWLFVHLIQIIGLRNRVLVLVNWAWNYLRYDRAHRIIAADDLPHDGRAGHTPQSNGSGG
jgi:NADH dehydrogenase